jgi:hypothetical protein
LLFDNILPLQISLLKQNLQGSQAEILRNPMQQLEPQQEQELMILAFSSTALSLFDNIRTLQMSLLKSILS